MAHDLKSCCPGRRYGCEETQILKKCIEVLNLVVDLVVVVVVDNDAVCMEMGEVYKQVARNCMPKR